MSLKYKFLAIGAITSFLAIILAVIGMVDARQYTGLIVESQTASTAMRNHMTGDMMHDGMRSDVYRALYAAQNAPQDRAAVLADVADHAELFRDRMAANREIVLPGDVMSTLAELGEPIEAYIEMAETITAAAFADPARARQLLPEFDRRFSALEVVMENASDSIEGAVNLASDRANTNSMISHYVMIAALIAAVLVGAGITIYMWRSLAMPIVNLAEAIRRLGEGDMEVELAESDRKDEIGEMMTAAAVFRDNGIERLRLEQNAKGLQSERDERQQKIDDLIEGFRAQAKDMLGAINTDTNQMEDTARVLTEIAADTSDKASNTTAASEEANSGAQSVAAATEELVASVSEIQRQVSLTSEVVSRASSAAADTNDTIASLDTAAQKIGDVMGLISDVAEQTNLLALNATIEAARAGEAGKGFAVVASEVKALASQTATATEEITSQIAGIQGSVREAIDAIQVIVSTVSEANEYTGAVAAAVEEQNAATSEINRSIQQVAASTRTVSEFMTGVSSAAGETNQSAGQAQQLSANVSEIARNLDQEVTQFLEAVAAA